MHGRRFLESRAGLVAAANQALREYLLVADLRDVFALTFSSGHLVVVRVDVALAHEMVNARFTPAAQRSAVPRTSAWSRVPPNGERTLQAHKRIAASASIGEQGAQTVERVAPVRMVRSQRRFGLPSRRPSSARCC